MIVCGRMTLEKLVGIFAIGNVQDSELDFALVSQICHFADRPFCGLVACGIGIKVEHDLLRFAVAEELPHLVQTQRRTQ